VSLQLPPRARVMVLGVILRVGALWTVLALALVTSPWLGDGLPGLRVLGLAVLLGLVGVPVACLTFPHARFGSWAASRMVAAGGAPTRRAVNLTEELAIATGAWTRFRVLAVDSPVPNVGALPGIDHTTVVVTSGAEQLLPRDELEALMATQVVVASDRWVRIATAAQLFDAPRFAILFGSGFLNPFLIPLAFLAFQGHRRGDAVRDMVADHAALRATRHPDALVRALYRLRPAAPHSSALRVGLPAFLVDQYWVLSTRAPATTSMSSSGGARTWTTADEIAAEMASRADRVQRGSRGEVGALFDMAAWRQATRSLGAAGSTPAGFPLGLAPDEREIAADIGVRLRAHAR
jgi:Zn-dependent protease with chaperone function